jgi:hypothetical protein
MNGRRPSALPVSEGVPTGAAKRSDAGGEQGARVAGDAGLHQSLTVEIEHLLDQAAGFARGGDYLGAQARVWFAKGRLGIIAASLPAKDALVMAMHAHLDSRIRHYDSLVREWQGQVQARSDAYIDRERRAIGADRLPRAQ